MVIILNKKQLLVILPVIVVLCSFYPLMEASATHLYTGFRWTSTTGGPWCADNSLGHLNIGLSNSINAISTASNYINGFSSHWTLPRIANNGDCRSHMYAASLAINTLGRTDWSYNTNTHKFIQMNTVINQNIQWTTSGCTDGQYPIRMSYLMKHEFTHWLQMKHGTDRGDATYPTYVCNAWDGWNSHSQSTAKSVYG